MSKSGFPAEDQSVQSHCLAFARLWTILDNVLTVQVHPVVRVLGEHVGCHVMTRTRKQNVHNLVTPDIWRIGSKPAAG